MKLQGNLQKMLSEASRPVTYRLELGGRTVTLNDFIGQPIRLEYLQQIECIHCGRSTNKSLRRPAFG